MNLLVLFHISLTIIPKSINIKSPFITEIGINTDGDRNYNEK